MLLSWNGAHESKELHKMEETKEKETKEKNETVNNKNAGHFRNMSTDYKAQKESCASRSVDILFLLYLVFALKMSVAG